MVNITIEINGSYYLFESQYYLLLQFDIEDIKNTAKPIANAVSPFKIMTYPVLSSVSSFLLFYYNNS